MMARLLLVFLAALFSLPPELPPDAAWRLVKVQDGVTVRTAPSGRRPPWGDAQGTIDATPEAVLAHAIAFAEMPKHVPRLAQARVLRSGDGEAVVYYYIDLPWPISDRDYTAHYHWKHLLDGHIVITAEDANAEGPPPTGAIRVPLVRELWQIAPLDGGRTSLHFFFLSDYGGSLTQGMLDEAAWKGPLQTFIGVREALAARRARP